MKGLIRDIALILGEMLDDAEKVENNVSAGRRLRKNARAAKAKLEEIRVLSLTYKK